MKRIISLVIILATVTNGYAQAKWTKEDRNSLYSDCITTISVNSSVSNEQKESICLCYIDAISKRYSKDDYQAKIDIEIRRIREVTLSQCSKDIGVDFSAKKEELRSEDIITKKQITGHWKDDNSEFWLFETGDYKIQYNTGKSAKGTWQINENQLNLYKDRLFGKSEKLFKILMFNDNNFVYQSLKDKALTFKATRVKQD